MCIAEQAAVLGGSTVGLLIITGAWTGARWGELTGLQRVNTHLVERLRASAPLNSPDPSTFYGGDERGYLDYPTLERIAVG